MLVGLVFFQYQNMTATPSKTTAARKSRKAPVKHEVDAATKEQLSALVAKEAAPHPVDAEVVDPDTEQGDAPGGEITPASFNINDFGGSQEEQLFPLVYLGGHPNAREDCGINVNLGKGNGLAPKLNPDGSANNQLTRQLLRGISIVHNIGSEKATKLNLLLQDRKSGLTIKCTSAFDSWMAVCLLAGYESLSQNNWLDEVHKLSFYRGDQGRRPWFASFRVNGQKLPKVDLYNEMADLLRLGKDGHDELLALMTSVTESINEKVIIIKPEITVEQQ